MEEYNENDYQIYCTYQFHKVAPNLFLGAYAEDGVLIGFITSTIVHGPLTEEGMEFVHFEEGDNICIHSVCVDRTFWRQGVGSQMLNHYVGRIKTMYTRTKNKVDYLNSAKKKISLICKEHLVGFYEASGFVKVGISSVSHGVDSWIDMVLEF